MADADPRSDADLVAAAKAGDIAAFEALYRRHRDWVVRLARRFTGSDDLALDVLQETFFYLLRVIPGLRLNARLTTFLYPAVRNISIAVRRKAQRLGAGEDRLKDVPSQPPTPDAHPELEAALAALPEEQREVVLLRFVDDLPLDDIASALRIPPGTVKSRLHYALETLRNDARAKEYFGP